MLCHELSFDSCHGSGEFRLQIFRYDAPELKAVSLAQLSIPHNGSSFSKHNHASCQCQLILLTNRHQSTLLTNMPVGRPRTLMMSSLDQYIIAPSRPAKHREDPKVGLVLHPSLPTSLGDSFFVGADYDRERRSVYIKLYEPQTQKIHFWYDNTGHLPYCFSKRTVQDLQKVAQLTSHPGFLRFENSNRYDAIEGKGIPVTIVFARDPLSIGGRPVGCIRDIITAWEADIRYVENYIYDRKLEPGMTYSIRSGDLKEAETQPSLTGTNDFF